jgi:hypothetical protein
MPFTIPKKGALEIISEWNSREKRLEKKEYRTFECNN